MGLLNIFLFFLLEITHLYKVNLMLRHCTACQKLVRKLSSASRKHSAKCCHNRVLARAICHKKSLCHANEPFRRLKSNNQLIARKRWIKFRCMALFTNTHQKYLLFYFLNCLDELAGAILVCSLDHSLLVKSCLSKQYKICSWNSLVIDNYHPFLIASSWAIINFSPVAWLVATICESINFLFLKKYVNLTVCLFDNLYW